MRDEIEPRAIRDAVEAARNAGADNLSSNLSSEFLSETAIAAFAQFPPRAWLEESFENGGFSYRSLALHLQAFEPEDKIQILTYFFGHKGVNVPNGEELGRFLSSVSDENFLSPTQEPDADFVQAQVNSYFQALKLENIPAELVKKKLTRNRDPNDLRNSFAWKEAGELILRVGRQSGRSGAQEEAECATEGFVNIALWELQQMYVPRLPLQTIARPHREAPEVSDEIGEDVKKACQWIVVQDLMPQEGFTEGNPFIHKVLLDRLGLVRTNVTGNTPEARKVIITIPKIHQVV